jgi:energy-converting hydrogenase Eha subunit A
MDNTTITSGAYMKQLKLVHKIMVTAIVLFSLIVVIILKTANVDLAVQKSASFHSYAQFIIPILAIGALFGGSYMFKKMIDSINAQPQLKLSEKLNQYRSASILRWSCIESPMILSAIIYLMTGKYFYLIILFLFFVLFILYTPHEEKVKMHLNLSSKEASIMDEYYAEVV